MIELSKRRLDEAYRQALLVAGAGGAFQDPTTRARKCLVSDDGHDYQVVLRSPVDGEVTVAIPRIDVEQALQLQTGLNPLRSMAAGRPQPGSGFLYGAARLLPLAERADWLEEQQGYLADLSPGRARWMWVLSQLAAMPRYAYTVRTGREEEPA